MHHRLIFLKKVFGSNKFFFDIAYCIDRFAANVSLQCHLGIRAFPSKAVYPECNFGSDQPQDLRKEIYPSNQLLGEQESG